MVELLTQFVNSFMHFYLVYFFFSIFWQKKYKPIITISTFSFLSIALSLALVGFGNGALRFICVFGLTFAFSFLFKSKIFTKLIYVSIIYAINSIIELLVVIVMQSAFAAEFNFTNYNSTFIIGMLVSKFVTIVLLIILKFKKHDKLLGYFSTKSWNLLLFPIASLLCSILIATIFFDAPNQSNTTQFLTLITFSALVVANMMIFDYIDSISENIKTKHTIEFANRIIAQQTIQYQELINHNQEILKLRHDHKNFCVGIMSELKAGNVENAIAILDKEYNLSKNESLLYGNVVTSIINIKQQAASENNISLLCDYVDASKINIKPTDLAILLGNALDNAIDACKLIPETEKKYIETDISVKNDTVYIMIKNPTCGKVDVNNLTSTKAADPSRHGFGIASMKQIAEKYCGEVLFSLEDDIFNTVIMLKNLV